MSGTAGPVRQFLVLARDVAAVGGGRLAAVAALSLIAAAAEGVGLLLLVPVLGRLGVDGAPAGGIQGGSGIWASLDGAMAALGLEGSLALYVALVGAAAWIVQVRGTAVLALRLRFVDGMRRTLHEAILAMEWPAFARMRSADVTHTAMAETAQTANGVEFLLRVGGWAVEIPVLLTVAARLSPAMTGVLLLLAGAAVLLLRPLNRHTFILARAAGEAHRALNADLTDDLAGMRVIRSFGLETARHARFVDRLVDMRARQLAHNRNAGTIRAITQVGAATVAAAAVLVAIRGLGMALADTLVLLLAFARLANAAMRIQTGWSMILQALPAHANVQRLLERCRAAAEPVPAEPVSADGAAGTPPRLARDIRLNGIYFRHPDGAGDGQPALQGVTATIPAHAMTAVIGPSGAGKSTLAELLLGLAAPTEGRILVDGLLLDGAARPAWRGRVAYVPQDSFLFHDTIRANLTAAFPERAAGTEDGSGEAALWGALEQAAMADVVRALPAGLDTVVGDRGARLSGGERQRLALARALLRRPDLLVLDEATSALDGDSERRILEALERLRGRLTIVTIAHRPSTVRGADHVVVLEAGRVVDSGPWAAIARRSAALLDRLAMLEEMT